MRNSSWLPRAPNPGIPSGKPGNLSASYLFPVTLAGNPGVLTFPGNLDGKTGSLNVSR